MRCTAAVIDYINKRLGVIYSIKSCNSRGDIRKPFGTIIIIIIVGGTYEVEMALPSIE